MPVFLSNNSPWVLGPDQQVAGAPVEIYRRTQAFVLETNGLAETLVVDASASQLAGRFLDYSYDVRNLAEVGVQVHSGNTVRVTLPAPRRVKRVKLDAGVLSAGATIGLHRLDLDKVSEEATQKLANNNSVTPSFHDTRFALRLSDNAPFAPAHVQQIEVTSYAASPRLGVTLTGLTPEPEPAWFWNGSGEIGQGGEPADGRIVDGSALAAALERLLNRHLSTLRAAGQPLPAQIAAALIVESNAPCLFHLETLTVSYCVLTATRLGEIGPAATEKLVIRFARDRLADEQLTLRVRAGTPLHTATLRAVASRTPSAAGGALSDLAPQEFPPPSATTGFLVEERTVALAFTAAATTVTGLAVVVLALSPALDVTLSLRADANGSPAGPELAIAPPVSLRAGERRWIIAPIPLPVPLSSAPCWLLLRAAGGACIWLDAPPGDFLAPPRLSAQSDGRAPWLPLSADGLAGLAWRLLSPPTVAPELAAELGAAHPGLTCSLGDTQLPDTVEGDTHIFNLAPALNDWLATSPPADANGLVSVPLTLHALGLRQATVYPPRLEWSA